MPLNVTICVPCFNNQATLAATLKSILNQDYESFDVVLIDNHSTDNSLAIATDIAKSTNRLRIIRNEKNLGLEGNLTRCIEVSESEITAIWHSDDLYAPELLRNQMNVFKQDSNITAVFAHGSEINDEGNELHSRYLPTEWSKEQIVKLDSKDLLHFTLRYGNIINCPTLTARSSILKKQIRHFNYGDFKSSADLDVWFRLAEIGPIAVLTKSLFKYRISEASFSVREIKKRTTRHDLFLVLQHQIKKAGPSILETDLKNYGFLEMKDLAVRSWNWRNSKSGNDPLISEEINWSSLFGSLAKSRFHFKFGVAAILIFLSRRLKI